MLNCIHLIKKSVLGFLCIIGITLTICPCQDTFADQSILLKADPKEIQRLLTTEEKQWLSEHNTINIAGPAAFPPFYYYDDGNVPRGMASDYISLITKMLNLNVNITPHLTWPEVLKAVKEGRVDLVTCSAKSKEREDYMAFSEPYLSFPMVILTHTDAPFISGLDDLHGKKVTFVKEGVVYDWIKRDEIGALPYFVDTPLDALKAVALGRAEAHIGNLAASTYLIQKNGLVNLEVAAPTAYGKYHLYMAARKDWPELVSIINKTLSIIPPQQHSLIRDRWLAVANVSGMDNALIIKWILGIGGLSMAVIAAILVWNRRLRREISKRRQADIALEESRRQMATLIDNLPGMAYRCRNASDYQMEFVSDGSGPLTGYQPEDLIHNKVTAYVDLIHPQDREKVWDRVQSAIEANRPFELIYRIKTAHSEEKWVWEMGRAVSDEQGQKRAIEGFITDITERIVAESELNRSLADWQKTFDAVNAAIWILDKNHNILRSNKNVTPYFNKPHQELVGKKCWEVLHDENRPDPDCPLPLARKSLRRESMEVKTEHGWFEIVVDPILDSAGKYAGAVHIATDITKRKKNELEKEKLHAQLIQSQKMESVGRLAGGVAHDFNNMLSVITGHAELALEEADPSSSLHQDLEEIFKAAMHSADLTRQLLAFARKQTAAPKILDLNDTVAGTLKMLRRLIGEDIDLSWMPGADLWPVKIDPAQIDQILTNLCVNGRDAIEGVGKITIETKNLTLDESYCTDNPGFKPGEYGMLAVSDNGQGIDKEIRDKIFEPFFTTKKAGRGTGLGLATVYGIVKQNSGFINVSSEPKQGTTFKVFLPRVEKKREEKTIVKKYADLTGTETILLVEDEETVLRLAERMLKNLGYKVFSALAPAEAMRLAKGNPDIHVMITDVVMPEMNGQELKERISKMVPGIKTLFMSGYTSDVISNHGILESETHYLEKPFTAESLGTKVREVIAL